MNANERIGWINKLNKKDAYIKTLTEGIRDLNTKIYQDKMAADAVNERKNKQIAEQQAEIEALKESLRRQEFLNRKLHELDERKYSRIGKLKKKLEKAQEK